MLIFKREPPSGDAVSSTRACFEVAGSYCRLSEALRSLCRGGRIAIAVDGEWQVEPEAVDDETQARFDEEIKQRLEQFRSQLDLTGRANGAFASAVGLDVSKIPPELLRELEQVAERMSKNEPPPLPEE